jgi:hypothetical protein
MKSIYHLTYGCQFGGRLFRKVAPASSMQSLRVPLKTVLPLLSWRFEIIFDERLCSDADRSTIQKSIYLLYTSLYIYKSSRW